MFKSGTFLHSAWRGFASFIAFGIPLLLMQLPVSWQSMTLGGVLMMLAHYMEKNLQKK